MRQGVHRLLSVSPADGQAILGQTRPVVGQSTFRWRRNYALENLLPANSPAPVPGAHQSAGRFMPCD